MSFGLFSTLATSLQSLGGGIRTIGKDIQHLNQTGARDTRNVFSELVTRSVDVRQQARSGYGTGVHRQSEMYRQGVITPTNNKEHVAISGRGFFVVEDENGVNPQRYLSRDGQFELRSVPTLDGNLRTYLTDKEGYYVMAWPLDPDGSIANAAGGQGLGKVELDKNSISMPAKETTAITWEMWLPQEPSLGDTYEQDFTVFTEEGVPQRLRYKLIATEDPNIWDAQVEYYPDTNDIIPSDMREQKELLTFEKHVDYRTSALTEFDLTYTDSDGAEVIREVSVTLNANADSRGRHGPIAIENDGYSEGILLDYVIDAYGRFKGRFSNEQEQYLYQLGMADVISPEKLTASGGTYFAESPLAGETQYYVLDGSLRERATMISGHVETSTVDLSREFSDMIALQQTYAATNNALQVFNEMTQNALNLKS